MTYTVIAIAGLPGSGKSTLLNALKTQPSLASWNTISTGMLLRERHAERLKEGSFTGDFIAYLEQLSDEDIRLLNDRARAFAKKGKIILDSRYAVENCKNLPHVLRIFLTAPLEIRVERLKKSYPRKSLKDIKQDLIVREQWELKRGMRIYGYDYRNTENYDLVIDTSSHTIPAEVALIKSNLSHT